MAKQDDGFWTLTEDLPPGSHTYTYRLASLSWFARGETIDISDPLARFLNAEETATVVVIPPPIGAADYAWKHDHNPHPSHEFLVIYELFVADVAADGKGTFNHVVGRLDRIAGMGFTAVELMPLGTADSTKGWGYTPKFFFAVEQRYGTEIELCRLVDEAHGRNLSVFIDGVYNHASKDCPLAHIDHDCYFHHDPKDLSASWGPQFNYSLNIPGTSEFPARHFIKQKIAHWINLFHVDGIRYDAVAQFRDTEFLGELTDWARERGGGKPFFAIAECLPPNMSMVGPSGPMDAWWRHEFGERMRSILSGHWDGDALERCFDCRRDGYASGKDAVNYLASHDTGHTVRSLIDSGLDEEAALYRMRIGLMVLFSAVGIPMVWMGDEVGAMNPPNQEPHPLDWESLDADPRRAELKRVTTLMLALRRGCAAVRGDNCSVIHRDDAAGIMVIHRWDDSGGQALIAVHAAGGDVQFHVKAPCPGRWRRVLAGDELDPDANGDLAMSVGGWDGDVIELLPERIVREPPGA